MKVKMYWKYFKYVCEHKKNVFICCYKESKGWFRSGKYKEANFYLWHGITHDMSKFMPCEFIPYAKWFYGEFGIKVKNNYKFNTPHVNEAEEYLYNEYIKCKVDFEYAWVHHYKHNKHHWDNWYSPITNTCEDMPYKYMKQMILDWTAMGIKFKDTPQEYYLNNYEDIELSDITRMWLEYELGLNDSIACNYGHTLKQFVNMYDEYTFNSCFGYIKKKYNLDIYKKLKSS